MIGRMTSRLGWSVVAGLTLTLAIVLLTAMSPAGRDISFLMLQRWGVTAPVTVDPAAGDGDTLAVIYSGDGGWAPIDRGLASGLSRAGIPVVGVDSLRYFWTARTPQAAAADLTMTLHRYMKAWGKRRILLEGYSFGADALPAIVPYLPADLRSHIRLVALVGLENTGALQFHPGSWLRLKEPGYPMAAEMTALRGLPAICIYGDREVAPACPALAHGGMRGVRLTGGHHYDGDYGAVSRAIITALPG